MATFGGDPRRAGAAATTADHSAVNQHTRTAKPASGNTSARRSPGKSAAVRTGTRKAAAGAATGRTTTRSSDDLGAPDASRRKFVVFLSLVGLLTGTSALLLAL